MDFHAAGLQSVEASAAPPIGHAIDRREHFFYADQSRDAARELMEDLRLDSLPLVDRSLRIVDVLNRE